MKATAYIRFSSEGQKDGSSIERQTEIIDEYCQRTGLELVEVFTDNGFSASKGDHITHGKLGTVILPRVDAGKYKGFALVVEKDDRFSRLGIAKDFALLNRLIEGGVELHFAGTNQICRSLDDLNTVILKAVGSYGAKQHTDNLKINIQKGKEERKDRAENNGWILSRSVPVWLQVVGRENIGNKIVNPGKFQEIPEMVEVVREAYRMASLGMGRIAIFEKLNGRLDGLSLSWISKLLSSRTVLGEFTPAGRAPIPGYYPAIIDQQLFDEVRRQAQAKSRKMGGNRRHSDRADNLLQGLVYDEDRKMYYQPVQHKNRDGTPGSLSRYLVSKKTDTRPINRIRYDKVALKVVNILEREDWLAIRGMSESAEYIAAKSALEGILSLLDKTQNHLNLMNSYMEGDDTDKIEIAMRFIKKDETTIAALQARLDELQATLDAATKRSAALYQDEELRAIIREVKANPDMRMRLRSEIQKRVARITLKFNPGQIDGTIEYVNGAESKPFTIEC